MRKPIENGLASMCTPRACSISKVSRALWPSASTTWSARSLARRVGAASAARSTPRAAAVFDQQVGDPRSKRISPPSALDLGAHLLDHADQPEGADVRLGDEQDLLGRAGLDEFGRAPCA